MTEQEDEARDLAFIASEDDPQRRQESAWEIIEDCRRIIIRRLADASRQHNQPLVEALKANQKKYDDDLLLIGKNNSEAITRTLTEHAKFLRTYNKAMMDGQKPPDLNDGPR